MRERLDAYEELKYTAINCGIDTNDIPFFIEYISSDFEGRNRLRQQITQKKSRKGALLVILHLSKMNSKALEVLENNVARFIERRENQVRSEYNNFINSLNTDSVSKELLTKFAENPENKLLLIPLYPKIESLCCIALEHNDIANTYSFSERCARIIKLFKEHPHIFAVAQGKFILKEDTPFLRSQIEQSPKNVIQ